MSNYRGKFDGEEGNTYGQRGGVGATRGRKSVLYEATLPNGKVVRKRSFFVDQEVAFLGTFQVSGGEWQPGGIFAEVKKMGDLYRFVEARRVK